MKALFKTPAIATGIGATLFLLFWRPHGDILGEIVIGNLVFGLAAFVAALQAPSFLVALSGAIPGILVPIILCFTLFANGASRDIEISLSFILVQSFIPLSCGSLGASIGYLIRRTAIGTLAKRYMPLRPVSKKIKAGLVVCGILLFLLAVMR